MTTRWPSDRRGRMEISLMGGNLAYFKWKKSEFQGKYFSCCLSYCSAAVKRRHDSLEKKALVETLFYSFRGCV